jgi:putative phosphoesterase
MKIAIVSDIHCNAAGLRAALDLMGHVDELICSGDAIYQYRFSNEVVALLRECGAHVILGNHEASFLSPDGIRAQSAPSVDRDLMKWLADQPETLRTRVNGKSLFVVHGSPWAPFSEYLYPTNVKLAQLESVDADYVVLGHTHYQMAQRYGRVGVINSGSAGESRDPRNDRRLSFAVLDTAAGEVSFCNYSDPARPRLADVAGSSEPVWTVTDLSGEPAGG